MTVSIEAFLAELDRQIEPSAEPLERLDLFHIGRSALVMHHGSTSSTSDFDVVQMDQRLESIAIELFGKGTSNAQRLGMYLELVPQGIPPVPQNFRGHCTEVAGPWRVLRLWRLDPHDLAVTKLKSFRPQDREDLQYLCDGGLIQEAPLDRRAGERIPVVRRRRPSASARIQEPRIGTGLPAGQTTRPLISLTGQTAIRSRVSSEGQRPSSLPRRRHRISASVITVA